jgi:hypothetical protein
MTTSNEKSEGPWVEPEVMLRYLIHQCDEISQDGYLSFPQTFTFLGFATLYPYPELLKDFDEIVLSEVGTLEDRARACKELFIRVLTNKEALSHDYPEVNRETGKINSTVSWYFLRAAVHEGEKMLSRADYEFVTIFQILGSIGLSTDARALNDFEATCAVSDQPEKGIEEGLEIITRVLGKIRSIRIPIQSRNN